MSMQINDLPKPLQDQIKRDEFQDQKTLKEQKQFLYEKVKELINKILLSARARFWKKPMKRKFGFVY